MYCGICFEKYDTDYRKPLSMFPCEHTYCKQCIDSSTKRECPTCKEEIRDIQINYDLMLRCNETPGNKIANLKCQINEKLKKASILKDIFSQKLKTVELEHTNTVEEISSNLKAKTDEIIQQFIQKQKNMLNDIRIVSSNFSNSIMNLKKSETLKANKLTSIKNSIDNDLANLEKINIELDLLNLNSEIETISNLEKESSNELSKINLNDLYVDQNEEIVMNKLASKYYNEAHDLFYRSKIDQALELLNKSIALKKDFTEAYHMKGRCLDRLNKLEEAIEFYDKSLEIDSSYIFSYNYKGLALDCLSKSENAKYCFELALVNLKANDLDHDYHRIFSFSMLKKHQEALTLLEKAIETCPNDASFYYLKSCSLSSLEKYSESISSLDKAIEINPNYDYFYITKALALIKLDEHLNALKCIDKALELNPKCYFAFTMKLTILYKQNKLIECIETVDKALTNIFDFYKAYDYKEKASRKDLSIIKLDCLINLQRYEEALKTADDLLNGSESDDDYIYKYDYNIYKYKGEALAGLKRKKEAVEAFKRALKLKPDDKIIAKRIKHLERKIFIDKCHALFY